MNENCNYKHSSTAPEVATVQQHVANMMLHCWHC